MRELQVEGNIIRVVSMDDYKKRTSIEHHGWEALVGLELENFRLKEEAEQKAKNQKNTIIISAVLFALVVSVSFYFLYPIVSEFFKSIETQKVEQEMILVEAEERRQRDVLELEFRNALLSWDLERFKSVESLSIEDFSSNPISETPEIFRDLISQKSNHWNVPASLVSAQIWVESRFNPNANMRQTRRVRDARGRWIDSLVENSYGLGQINLVAHTEITMRQAKDPEFAINFIANRWRTMMDYYRNKTVLFWAMAYNTPGVARSAEEYMNFVDKYPSEIRSIRLITNYGRNVLSIARNERLREIYSSLFSKFENKNFNIPPMELLPVSAEDYRNFVYRPVVSSGS